MKKFNFLIPKTSSAFLLLHQGNLYYMMILMPTTQANELERGCTLAAYVIPRLGQGISVHCTHSFNQHFSQCWKFRFCLLHKVLIVRFMIRLFVTVSYLLVSLQGTSVHFSHCWKFDCFILGNSNIMKELFVFVFVLVRTSVHILSTKKPFHVVVNKDITSSQASKQG